MRKMYSKKQIEEIAKVVGGSNLYHHTIDNSGDSLYIISTDKEPYDISKSLGCSIGHKGVILIMVYYDSAGIVYLTDSLRDVISENLHNFSFTPFNTDSAVETMENLNFSGVEDVVVKL